MIFPVNIDILEASPVVQLVKNLPAMQKTQETWVWSLGWEDPLEEEWQPTPVFLPGESHGRRAWQDTVHEVAKSQTQLSDNNWILDWYFKYSFTFHFHLI